MSNNNPERGKKNKKIRVSKKRSSSIESGRRKKNLSNINKKTYSKMKKFESYTL